MFLKTKTEVHNPADADLGLKPDYITINMILRISDLIGVREHVEQGEVYPKRCVVILKTGEEYGILTPYQEVVDLLSPPLKGSTGIDPSSYLQQQL